MEISSIDFSMDIGVIGGCVGEALEGIAYDATGRHNLIDWAVIISTYSRRTYKRSQ